ncbi:cytochrome P450 [Pseudomassariella vexata]|uniref:Cytochrome P450 n=1 Tax=Pseudomassariella vexata TaxID=1141098 RepID=A0A1Y2E8E6_9PEZI|nr:cytochrome P450 [Pseudomassariella vexata]ORY67812.1 cytochrome P450 [Pseudomassariella vexata]
MPTFLEIWLPLWACTSSALLFKYLTDPSGAKPVTTLLTLELCSLGLWAIYWMILYPSYFTPFRHLPTPPGRSWLYGNRNKFIPDNAWEDVRTVIETLPNNGLIRYYEAFSREVLLVTNIEAIKEMNSVKPFDFGHPKQVKYMLGRITSSKFNFLSEHGHKLFRKHLRPAFTVTHTKKLMPAMWKKSGEMVRIIETELQRNPETVIDFRDYIRRVMWDTSGVVMMGHDFQTLGDPDGGIRDRFAKLLAEFSGPAWIRLIMYYIDLRPILTFLSPLFMKTSLGRSLNYIRHNIWQVVAQKEDKFRKTGSLQKYDDLDITSVSVESGIFPTSELIDNGMLFLTAGPNSTGTAIEWALYELGRRPEMQKRLRSEIIDGCPVSMAADEIGPKLQSLPYLSAVCNEVIRCYPFVPLSPKVVEKDTTLLGERVPKDTAIQVAVEFFNRDTKLWGPDGDEFNPDRWLGEDASTTGGAISNFAMLSFGAGPNICIGQNQARAMLACLVAAIVRRFDIQLANAETAGKLRPAPFKKSEEGIMAKLKIVNV